jgi:hypothetical protein
MIPNVPHRPLARAILPVKWGLLGVTLLVGVYQLAWVGRTAGRLMAAKVWVNRTQDAINRSADAAYGQEYMECMRRLREKIPEDALVIVTRTTGLPQYDSRSFLQYFLFPRELLYCSEGPGPDCVRHAAAEQAYILAGTELEIPSELLTDYKNVPCGSQLLLLAPSRGEAGDD